RRQDLAQRSDVGIPAAAAALGGGIPLGGGFGGGELGAYVAGQVVRCRDERLGPVGVGEDDAGECLAGVVLAAAEQAGDLVDAAGASPADPVDRPPLLDVGVVAGVQLRPQ